MTSPCLRSWKFSRPIPHSKPSRTSRASSLKRRSARARLVRDGVQVWEGTLASLKRFKDDVREVQAGYECGIGLSDFQDLKQGDVIETYELREIARTLS